MPIPKTAIEYLKSERAKQTPPYQKFYDEAIEALEKTIPQKCIENDEIDKRNNHNDYKCPGCGLQVYRTFMPYRCGSCGQVLDWSEAE